MKKTLFAIIAIALVATACLPSMLSAEAGYINEDDNEIKVFIGTTDGYSSVQADEYIEEQSSFLESNVLSNSYDTTPALITFKTFVSESAAEEVLSAASEITRIYLWTPGKTGRAIVQVSNNDVEGSIQKFFSETEQKVAESNDELFKNDMTELASNYGIFAAEVIATYDACNNLLSGGDVYVDIVHSNRAETRAQEQGKDVTYICIPDKPDGTQ